MRRTGTLAAIAAGLLGLPIATVVAAPAARAASACASATSTWDRGAGTDLWSDAANWAPNGVPNAAARVCIPAGAPGAKVVLTTPASVAAVESQKPFEVAGDLTVTSLTTDTAFSGLTLTGVLRGPAAVTVTGAATLRGSIVSAAVRVEGSATVPSFGQLGLIDGGRVVVAGSMTLDASTGYSYVFGSCNGASTCGNQISVLAGGVLSATDATSGWDAEVGVGLDNDGTVRVDAGHLRLSGDSSTLTSAGRFMAAGTGVLHVGSATWGPGAAVTGAVVIEGAVSAAGLVADAGAHLTIAGSLASTADVVVQGDVTLTGSLTGPGTRLVVRPGASSVLAGQVSSALVRVEGSATVPSFGQLSLVDGGRVVVAGSMALDASTGYSYVLGGCTGASPCGNQVSVLAGGVLSATDSTAGWDPEVSVPVDNDGVVRVDAGHLRFTADSDALTSAGRFVAAPAGVLHLAGVHRLAGASLEGSGVRVEGTVRGTAAVVSGTPQVPGVIDGAASVLTIAPGASAVLSGQIASATVRIEGTATVPSFGQLSLFDGARLEVAGSMTLDASTGYSYVYGGCTGASPCGNQVSVLAGGVVSATDTTSAWEAGITAPLDNDGTVRVDAGDLHITGEIADWSPATGTLGSGTFAAFAGARLHLDSVAGPITTLGGTLIVDGAGSSITDATSLAAWRQVSTITSTGGLWVGRSQSLTLPAPLTTAGSLTVGKDAALTVTGTVRQTAGATRLLESTSSLTATGSVISILGGSIGGRGSAGPSLAVDGGTVAPGSSVGALTAAGTTNLGASSITAIELGGTSAGTSDKLVTTGAATLGGTLAFSIAPGYAPQVGDSIDVATFSSRGGSTFSSVAGLSAGPGKQLAVSYSATKVTVSVVAVPGVDLAPSVSAASTPFVSGASASAIVSVVNGGGAASSGTVSVAIALPAGFAFTGGTGSGWSCAPGGAGATCTRPGALAPGASAPSLTIGVDVTGAAGTRSISATVSGGGDSVAGNNTFTMSVPVVSYAKPVASITPSTNVSVIAGATITFDGSASFGTIDSYRWQYGDGSQGTGPITQHRYGAPGVYVATLVVSNPAQSGTATRRITVLDDRPLAAAAGDDVVTTPGKVVSFSSAASTPNPGIEATTWSFGDGTSPATTAAPTHSWTTPGTYTVQLTVARGGLTATDALTVTVLPPSSGGLAVTVNGTGGAPISGAQVTVIASNGDRYTAVASGTGVATVQGLANGAYTAYAYAPGFTPGVGQAMVTNGSGALTITLASGAVGTSVTETKRLTYDEIIAAGINPADPANQNVYEFVICLAFNGGSCVNLDATVNGDGTVLPGSAGFGGPAGNGCAANVCTVTVGGVEVRATIEVVPGAGPVVSFLMLPGKASWLKEFFEVKQVITNLAPAGFTFTDGAATIDLPDGLSLAPTGTPQDLTVEVPPIAGGAQGTASWIVRGDVQGDYPVTATYTGTLDPIGAAVRLVSVTKDPIKVWGLSALQIVVDADDAAVVDEPYRFRVGIKNVTTGADATPVYNPAIEMLNQAGGNFVYQPRQTYRFETDVIAPGTTWWAPDWFVVVPTFSGALNVAGSAVLAAAGPDAPAADYEVLSHPRTPALAASASGGPGSITVSWQPVAGLPTTARYGVFRSSSVTTAFDETPLTTVASNVTSATVPSAPGVEAQLVVSVIDPGVPALLRHRRVAATAFTAPSVSIGDLAVVEGDDGARTVSVPVTMDAPYPTDVTVTWATADGSATAAGRDLTPASGTLTIKAGAVTGYVKVKVNGDRQTEDDESFTIQLVASPDAYLARTSGTVTLLDDDGPGTVVVSIAGGSVVEGDGGPTAKAPLQVTLDEPAAVDVSVVVTSTAGTAASPADFTYGSKTVTIPAGAVSAAIQPTIVADGIDESDESFTLALSSPVGATIGVAAATVTILDDDPGTGPRIGVGDAIVVEGDAGSLAASFPVRLSAPQAGPVTVTYAATAGTATSSDVTAKTGTLTIAAGKVAGTIKVPVVRDGRDEPDESFTVTISNPSGATIVRPTAVGTILDDDPAGVRVEVGDVQVVEGDSGKPKALLPVTLSQPASGPVSITLTSGATGGDIGAVNGVVVTIPAGASSASLAISVKPDVSGEPDDVVTITATNPVGAVLGRSIGTVTVLNDD